MMLRKPLLVCLALLAIAPFARSQDVLITEFLASNDANLADEDGDFSDWLEIYNRGTSAVNLDGWYLTSRVLNKTQWRIPAVTVDPGKFLIVFCSKKNRAVPGAPLHTNFKIAAGGEYLALVMPDGQTVASEYAPMFPPQQTDVSYGMPFTGLPQTILAAGAPARAIVPPDATLGLAWTASDFVDTAWTPGTTGIGYERSSGYGPLIGLDLGSAMYNRATTAYIRVPFTVADPSAVDKLTLRMKYDDGFVAYLNGTRVASANAPDTLTYRSSATQINDDALAVQFQDFDITAFKGKLRAGTNVLAIHGMNATSGSSDFLIVPEINTSTGQDVAPGSFRYFLVPTPGAPNGTSVADQGPDISQPAFAPQQPIAGQAITVTARVTPAGSPLSDVTLTYRVDYGTPQLAPMLDDGAHGDGAAGDGVYGATIPGSIYAPGQMIRWFIKATDSQTHTARHPLFASPQSPEYLGTMAADPSVVSALPVLNWWVENLDAAGTEEGTWCSLFWDGSFYDHLHVRLRGNTSAYWPKKNYKLDMNPGSYFRYSPDQDAVEEFNLQSTYSDKTYMRPLLAWETYAKAGVPGCISFPVRVQRNGAFFSVADFLEQPDETMLTRNKLDADGALYKMYNECIDSVNNVEKKTRKTEDNSDLQGLVNGVQLTGSALTQYLFDNLDVPEAINYVAATVVMHDNDHAAKNYYLLRDTDRTGEWSILPWDKDLTFGRNFVPWSGGVLSDEIWAGVDPYSHPFFADRNHPKVDGPWNRLIDAMLREPTIRAMYLRRLRTVMDTILQPPGTPADSLLLEARIDALRTLMAPDVALDKAKWGNPYGADQSFIAAINIMKTAYLAPRRTHLYVTHSSADGLIPPAQPAVPAVSFGLIERSPASGNPDEEYVEVRNDSDQAVDLSGWALSGPVAHTFRPGTVVAAHGAVYVSPDVVAFRKRAASPKGGEGRLVQGEYSGRLAGSAATLELRTPAGALAATTRPTVNDVAQALQIAAGGAAAAPESFAALNVTPEDPVGISDAVLLARRALGIGL